MTTPQDKAQRLAGSMGDGEVAYRLADGTGHDESATSGSMDHSVGAQLALVDGTMTVVSLGAFGVILTGPHGGPAACLVLTAVVLGSGWALSGWLPYRNPSFSATLALSVGIAVPIVVGMICVGLGSWHPVGTVAGILILSALVNSLLLVVRLMKGDGRRGFARCRKLARAGGPDTGP